MFCFRLLALAGIVSLFISTTGLYGQQTALPYDNNTLLKIDFDNDDFKAKCANGKFVSPRKKGNIKGYPWYKSEAARISERNMLVYNFSGNFDPEQGTIECFFKLLPVKLRGTCYLLTLYLDDGNRILLRFDKTSQFSSFMKSGGKSDFFVGQLSSVKENEWYHFAFTWERENDVSFIRVYIDGQLVVSKKLGIKIPDVSKGKLYIGTWLDGEYPLRGIIDELRLSKIVRYNKKFYSELLTPIVKICDKELKLLSQKISTVKYPKVRTILDSKFVKISKEYSNLMDLRKNGKYEELLKQYKLFERKIKSFDYEIGYAQWWGQRRTCLEAILYTCMQKIDGIWKESYAKNKLKTINISSASNEWHSFQILLAMNPVYAKMKINISSSDLKSNTDIISRKNIHFYKVGLISYIRECELYKWPDPIYPVSNQVMLKAPFTVQPVWVNLYVPSNTSQGKYKGAITISYNGENKTVPIILDKLNFALPIRPRFQTAFGFAGTWLGQYYGISNTDSSRFKKLFSAYLGNMLAHKVSPKALIRWSKWNNSDVWFLAPKVIKTKDGKWKIDFKDYEKQLDKLLPLGLNTIMVGNRDWVPAKNRKVTHPFPYYDEISGTIKKREFAFMSKEMKEYARWILSNWYGFLKKKNVASMGYTYLVDEPSAGFGKIQKVAQFVHSIIPELKNMVTTEPHSECPDIDLPCPLINKVHANTNKLARENFWTYVCSGPISPHCNFLINQSSVQNRLPLWTAYKFGAKGFLYYEHARSLYSKGKDYLRWNRLSGSEGDGILVYPGKDGPINTIRFEYVRMGIQDVEYFLMLKELIKKLPNESTLKRQAEKLLIIPDSLIKNSANYCKDWKKFAKRKQQVGLMIEKVLKELKKIK